MRGILFVLLTCALGAIPAPLAAQEAPMLLSDPRARMSLDSARTQLLALRMPEGERTLRRLASHPEGAPAAYYHLAAASMLKVLLTGQDPYFDEFFERSDSFKAILDDLPSSPWRTFLGAEANLQRAIVRAKQGHYVRAALATRLSYRAFNKGVEEAPGFYESYKGLGLLHLAIGSLPKSYRRLLRVIGYGGELEEGLEELRLAASRSGYNRAEARIYLSLTDILLQEAKEDGAMQLGALYEASPESPFFAFLYGFALISARRTAEAETVLLKAARTAEDPAYLYIDYIDYQLAEARFRLGRFAVAIPDYERYLARHEGPALKALTHLHLGLALEMTDRRAEAVVHYQHVQAARDFDSDASAKREADIRLARPLSAWERSLMFGRSAFDSGQNREAERLFLEVMSGSGTTAAERGEASYRLGRVYHTDGRWEEALQAYSKAADAPGDPFAKWGPWARYYMGEVEWARGNALAARVAFEAVIGYTPPYDYHQVLEKKAQHALTMLKDL